MVEKCWKSLSVYTSDTKIDMDGSNLFIRNIRVMFPHSAFAQKQLSRPPPRILDVKSNKHMFIVSCPLNSIHDQDAMELTCMFKIFRFW